MTPCYTFLGIFELVDTKFIDGNIFAVLLSDSNDLELFFILISSNFIFHPYYFFITLPDKT
jgi:hypothetical protein